MTMTRGSLVAVATSNPPADYVKRMAARGFDVTVDALVGKSRERPLCEYRQVTMTAIRHMCRLSYPAIGMMFDGRDHTTVMHAVSRINEGRHHDAGSRRRKLWDTMNTLCDEVRSQWAIDTGQEYPTPGQLTMGGVLEGAEQPQVVFS